MLANHRNDFMLATHRNDRFPPGWASAANLFSLMFALLLALAFVVLLMLFFEVMRKEQVPTPAPAQHALTLAPGCVPWADRPVTTGKT